MKSGISESNVVKLVFNGHDEHDLLSVMNSITGDMGERVEVVEYAYGFEGSDGDVHYPHMHAVFRLSQRFPNSIEFLRAALHVDEHPQLADIHLGDSFEQAALYACKGGNYIWPSQNISPPWDTPNPEWNPLQLEILSKIDQQDDRRILCVIDKGGRVGKTFLAKWHAYRFKASMIPVGNSYKDLMRVICDKVQDKRNCSLIFVDIPRSFPQTRLDEFYAALETIKDGTCWDDRYRYQDIFFKPPKLCVFANVEPNLDYLTLDRWQIIEVQSKDTFNCFDADYYRDILQRRSRQKRLYKRNKQKSDKNASLP